MLNRIILQAEEKINDYPYLNCDKSRIVCQTPKFLLKEIHKVHIYVEFFVVKILNMHSFLRNIIWFQSQKQIICYMVLSGRMI